jgi:ElaA protein
LKINWDIKHYNELSLNEFHDLIQLRINVFVVEQNCPYSELDGKDKKSYHLIGRDGFGNIAATARILPKGIGYENDVAIGRVVVGEDHRGLQLGHDLMKECKKFIAQEFGETSIRLSAQKHLENYYKQHDFTSTGKEYLEDGIPHVEMLNNSKA